MHYVVWWIWYMNAWNLLAKYVVVNIMRMREKGELTKFFFTNILEEYEERHMWRIFQRQSEGSFHCEKENQGWRFGFVRFEGVARPREMESTLHRIFIGNTKLHVNFPKYGRKHQETSNATKTPKLVNFASWKSGVRYCQHENIILVPHWGGV